MPNTYFVKRVLKSGMEGKDVAYVQETLDDLNIYYNFYPDRPKLRDKQGFYGWSTCLIVWRFKEWMNIPNNHQFDKTTNDAMEQMMKNYLAEMAFSPEIAKQQSLLDRY